MASMTQWRNELLVFGIPIRIKIDFSSEIPRFNSSVN